MRNIKVLGGLASLLVMFGAVVFLAYGAVIPCGTGVAICVGTNGNDVITEGGTPTAKTIYGLGGKDIITDDAGENHIFGGSGDDDITHNGAGASTIFGDDGNDKITNVSTTDGTFMDGGRGNDTLTGSSANETFVDGFGRDVIKTGDGDNTVFLVGDNEQDTVIGGTTAASDVIVLDRFSGRDIIYCDPPGSVTADADIVYLNGNNKAVGRKGGVLVNLRQIALVGGSTDDCETIIP